MTVLFEGFPRTLERTALRPGRWFVAADGLRPTLCFATERGQGEETVILMFSAPRVEVIEVSATTLGALAGPFATVEDEVVFAPGTADGAPTLIAPSRRNFRTGCLLRLRSGDLGIGFVTDRSGEMLVVSLHTGERVEGFDLVFDRWSLSLRRSGVDTLLGYFKPHQSFADRKWV